MTQYIGGRLLVFDLATLSIELGFKSLFHTEWCAPAHDVSNLRMTSKNGPGDQSSPSFLPKNRPVSPRLLPRAALILYHNEHHIGTRRWYSHGNSILLHKN